MGFLSGPMTFERFQVTGGPKLLGEEQIELLSKFAMRQDESASSDGLTFGFLAGQHLFDTDFRLEKNVINDALHFGIRIDTNKVPGPLRQAWLQIELAALSAENPSGRPTKAQKQQAKETVDARCEEEAETGRFRRMQQFPLLWDVRDEALYLGSTSPVAAEHAAVLLDNAFGVQLERRTAGQMAEEWARAARKKTALVELIPAAFHTRDSSQEIAWMSGQEQSLDYLGNEFLLWLWWHLDTESDTIALSDGSEVTGMLQKTLALECPRGDTGKETITAESPVKIPEARLAIRCGKLPRKSGMILSRLGEQYQFVLQAETFAISGAKIDSGEESAGQGIREDRVESLRHFSETLDLLYAAFCERRVGTNWGAELNGIQRWVRKDLAAA